MVAATKNRVASRPINPPLLCAIDFGTDLPVEHASWSGPSAAGQSADADAVAVSAAYSNVNADEVDRSRVE